MNRTNTSQKNAWLLLAAAFIFVILILLIVLGYVYKWALIGVVQYTYKPTGSVDGVKDIKTLWDWLDLLIVPTFIAFGIWWLNRREEWAKEERDRRDRIDREHRELLDKQERERRELLDKQEREDRANRDRRFEEIRIEQERGIARERQLQSILESYFDRMSDLMIQHGLKFSSEEDPKRDIARTRTLSVLRELDGKRKGQVIQFLHEADLIKGGDDYRIFYIMNQPIVGRTRDFILLTGADLREAQLMEAILYEVRLMGVNLERANLSCADLTKADLSGANVKGANFTGAMMYDIKLKCAVYDSETKWPHGFDPTKAGAEEASNK